VPKEVGFIKLILNLHRSWID